MLVEQAAVVPVVIGVTQVLKPFKKYYVYHELLSLIIAFLGTLLVILYSMNEEAFNALTKFALLRLVTESIFTAFATWLSAAKLYDISLGKMKAQREALGDADVAEILVPAEEPKKDGFKP